jgi:hypothetical protein
VITAKQKKAVECFVTKSDGNLWELLQLLRSNEIGMTNTRRLLDEHPMNEGAIKALNAWAAQWPVKPTRFGKHSTRTKGQTDDGEDA